MMRSVRHSNPVRYATTAIRTLSAILVLWAGSDLVIADAAEEFHARVTALYDFEPRFRPISDESLMEFDQLTAKLRALQ